MTYAVSLDPMCAVFRYALDMYAYAGNPSNVFDRIQLTMFLKCCPSLAEVRIELVKSGALEK